MKTLRFSFALCTVVLFTGACAQPGGLFGPTVTPTPTLTPSPTPTPSPQEILAGGWAALTSDDLETAEEIADQVLERDEENGEAWALKGSIARERGDIPNTANYLEQAYQLGYEDNGIKSDLSTAYQFILDSMIDHMYTTWDPDVIVTDIISARDILSRLEPLLDQAEQTYYQELLNPVPTDIDDLPEISLQAEELITVGFSAMQSKDAPTAKKNFQQVIELHPDYGPAYLYLGVAEFAELNFNDSLDNLQKAIEILPNFSIVWGILGDTYVGLGLPEHAREAYVKALLFDLDDNLSHKGLGKLNKNLSSWEYTFFHPYGFEIIYDPGVEFSNLGDNPDPTHQEGNVRMTGDSVYIAILWNESTGGQSIKVNAQKIHDMVSALEFTPIGDPVEFAHGEVPMVYQVYTTSNPDIDQTINGIMAAWYCGDRSFLVDLFADDPELTLNKIEYLFIVYLESFSCEID